MYAANPVIRMTNMLCQRLLRRLGALTPAAVLVIFAAGCAAPVRADQPRAADTPGAKPDAVYELWEQHWTLNEDGTLVYRERTHVQLNSDRTYRTFADPRITYDSWTQELEVLEARTRLPDGSYVGLPDYSAVEVAPDAAAGWPAFGGLRQRVLVMSGIEPGCIIEIEHQITSKPTGQPFLAADLHIDDEYPVVARAVTVSLPAGHELSPVVSGIPEAMYQYSFQQNSDGGTAHRWDFTGLEGQPHEPQSIPWHRSGVRLAFTTAPDPDTWIRERLATIDTAASESPLATKLAAGWTADLHDPAEKLAALQEKFAATFNFVNFNVGWHPRNPRSATEVLRANYGLPAEAAAALLALTRAAGVPAQPALLVSDDAWEPRAAQPALIAAHVLVFDSPDGTEIWHPRSGRIYRDAHWAGHTLFYQNANAIARKTLPAWRKADESRCVVRGNVEIAEDGQLTGELTIRTTGLFVSPAELAARDDQKSEIKALVRHILPAANVRDFSVTRLSADTFETQVQIDTKDALDKLHDCYELSLADTLPGLRGVPIPWRHSRRETAARLIGPFDEQLDLTINWPEECKVHAVPRALARIDGPWGSIEQRIDELNAGIRLVRNTRIEQDVLAARDVLAIRPALQALRTDACRAILVEP